MRQQIGRPAISNRDFFVQTERKAHEEWAAMIVRAPMAAAVMHKLVALMDRQNAVAISHGTLAKLLNIHVNTVKTAIKTLESDHWIQVVQLGQRGTVNAYVINDQVAWADDRQKLPFSMFSATIVADAEDQSSSTLTTKTLRRVPVLYAGERQLAAGDGLPPPSQPSIPGMEPDLPARRPTGDEPPSQLDLATAIAADGGNSPA